MPIRRNDPIGQGYPIPPNLQVSIEEPEDGFQSPGTHGVNEDSYQVVGFTDPDSERRSKINFEPTSRGSGFPYDETEENNHDKGHGPTASQTHSYEIVPMDTAHTVWDELGEMIGYPALFSRAYSSNIGSPIPGMGGWSQDPPKSWDRGPGDDDEVNEEFDPETPPIESMVSNDGFNATSDSGVEKKLARIWGIGDNPNSIGMRVQPRSPMDVHSAWAPLEMVHQDSVWGELVKFMMMKDLMNKQRKSGATVVIKQGDTADDVDHQ